MHFSKWDRNSETVADRVKRMEIWVGVGWVGEHCVTNIFGFEVLTVRLGSFGVVV